MASRMASHRSSELRRESGCKADDHFIPFHDHEAVSVIIVLQFPWINAQSHRNCNTWRQVRLEGRIRKRW